VRGGGTITIKESASPVHRSLPLHRDALCLIVGHSEIYPLCGPYLENEDGAQILQRGVIWLDKDGHCGKWSPYRQRYVAASSFPMGGQDCLQPDYLPQGTLPHSSGSILSLSARLIGICDLATNPGGSLLSRTLLRPPHSGTAFAEGYEAAGGVMGGQPRSYKVRALGLSKGSLLSFLENLLSFGKAIHRHFTQSQIPPYVEAKMRSHDEQLLVTLLHRNRSALSNSP